MKIQKKIYIIFVLSLIGIMLTGFNRNIFTLAEKTSGIIEFQENAEIYPENDKAEKQQSDSTIPEADQGVPNEIESSDSLFSESYVIKDFPIIYQMPELPTGCEITAMTVVLNYYGFSVDKVQMATQYLPTLPSAGAFLGEDGRLYGNDMNQYFIGDPQTEDGIICGTGAIISAVTSFSAETGNYVQAVDRTGISLDELYQLISEDTPVMVWCTIGMEDRNVRQGWYTENGEYVDWASNDHGAVLIGYSPDTVTIADPISGLVEYSRTQFESVFHSRGNRCVILQE